jgi:hypothetical protein
MLQMSFPSLASRSFPRLGAGKQALWAATAVAAILAGCGGSGAQYRLVQGKGYSFDAPVGWTLVRTPRALGMQHGSVDLVQVTRLPLIRAYRPALFRRVVPELDRAAKQLGDAAGARVVGRTVRLLGEPVRQYDLQFSERVEQLTFVLRDRLNFQLLCRREADGDVAPCRRLVTSFRPG